MRGLKPFTVFCFVEEMESHLLQMRGLKPPLPTIKRETYVASFTDAWIETFYSEPCHNREIVASFTDAWIETNGIDKNNDYWESHLLQMRGLKHLL